MSQTERQILYFIVGFIGGAIIATSYIKGIVFQLLFSFIMGILGWFLAKTK